MPFSRRDFLSHIAKLMATSPFVLWSERARALTPFAFWKKRTAAGGGVYPTDTGDDPYWDYVVLCMNMDTPTPSTGFTGVFADESNVGKTPTISGSPYIDTGAGSSPFSGRTGSAKIAGTGNSLSFSSSDFDISTGDWTIEGWASLASSTFSSNSYDGTLLTVGSSTTNCISLLKWRSGHSPYGNRIQFQVYGASTQDAVTPTTVLSSSTGWFHFAATQQSGTLRFFVNGSLEGSTTRTQTLSALSTVTLGTNPWNESLNGALADVRIYRGIAKYTANFTPRTTPIGLGTANDKYWGYCVLACPFENSLKDMSGTRVTGNGTVALSSPQKKYGTASVSLDGTSSYLAINNNGSFDFGAGSFTIEAWVKWSQTSGNPVICSQTNVFQLLLESSSTLSFEYTTDGSGFAYARSSALSWTAGQWYHVALSRDNSGFRFFRDGTAIGTVAFTGILYTGSGEFRIGRNRSTLTNYFSGYIDSLRITKGFARYTADFTPPTASFPVGKDETVDPFWSYTVLAMHMDDFTDATGRHTFTSGNSATTSTSTKLFGTASLQLDGSSKYLTSSYSADYDFNFQDFTIEAWVNMAGQSAGGYNMIFVQGVSGGSGNSAYAFCISTNASNGTGVQLFASTSGSSWNLNLNGAVNMPYNIWHHVAVCRRGTSVTLFCNGSQVAQSSLGTLYSSTRGVAIGRQGDSADQYFNGYIDDLRITKGVARYVNNFTPPTRAFATATVSTYTDYDPFYSSVVLLMDMETITDKTGRQSITNDGPVTASTSIFKYGAKSASFNGSATKLTAPSTADFAFGSSDYTIEMWVYFNTISAYQRLLASDLNSCNFELAASGIFQAYDGSLRTTTASPVASTWNHVALSRGSGTARLFLNGTQILSWGSSVNYANQEFRIGAGGSSGQYNDVLNGYLDDVRITKGVARYTANFAPPSKALPTSAGIVTSGLVALLDAGDAASYDGSSQTWKNIVTSPADSSSQTTYDFYLGSSSSSENSDPAFVGVSGGRSANDYFSFDGGDYFSLAGANSTFINSLHKTGASFTIECWIYGPSSWPSSAYLISEYSAGSQVGINLMIESGKPRLWIGRGGTEQSFGLADQALPTNRWCMYALSFNESGGSTGAFHYVNGYYLQVSSSNQHSASYSSPSSDPATSPIRILGRTDGSYPISNGSRLAIFKIYNRALSKTELDQNFNSTRSRFGI